MNRHHPYGENPMRHGGASPPSGFGPDRSHRGGYRGGGRGGRGRGGGHNSFQSGKMNGNFNAYDQPPPDMGYGGYGNMQPQAPPQDPYYQNYGPGSSSAPYPPMNSSGYAAAPGYNNTNKYEDQSGSYDGDGGGYGQNGARRPPPPPRKDREDKVHDSIIEERIQRERPCRTLFIRNIKYETNSDDVRRSFEEHGDIKTFFDLISTRGMVFVTYFDLRAAERARERLQDTEISGRPIDVHYSLPRDDSKDAKNIEMQGSLQVTLRSSPSGQAIDDNEVRRKFQQFGDVKSVRPVGNRIDSRYVEYYDTRACFEAHDRLRHQGLQDGVMDIVFAWDTAAEANGTGGHRGDHDGRGVGRGRGRGRGGRGGGGPRDRDDDFDHRDRDRQRPRDEGYGERPMRGGGRGGYSDRGGYNDRYNDRDRDGYGPSYGGGGGGGGPPPSVYGGPPSGLYGSGPQSYGGGPSNYGQPPPPPPPVQQPPHTLPPTGADDRVEQARKVQQLLAALKQPVAPPSAMPPAPSAAPTPPNYFGGIPHQPGLPPPPPMPPQSAMPPYPGAYPPPATSTPQPGSAPPPGTLPPGIMAILQQQQGQQPGSYPGSVNTPPPAQPSLQALMSILQQQQATKR